MRSTRPASRPRASGVLVLGVAHKPNTSDIRESSPPDIIHLLQEKGAEVQYHYLIVPELHYDGIDKMFVDVLESALARSDCAVIVTDHTGYDWDVVCGETRLIVDTRNALAHRVGVNDPCGDP